MPDYHMLIYHSNIAGSKYTEVRVFKNCREAENEFESCKSYILNLASEGEMDDSIWTEDLFVSLNCDDTSIMCEVFSGDFGEKQNVYIV